MLQKHLYKPLDIEVTHKNLSIYVYKYKFKMKNNIIEIEINYATFVYFYNYFSVFFSGFFGKMTYLWMLPILTHKTNKSKWILWKKSFGTEDGKRKWFFVKNKKQKKNCIHALNFAYETIYLLYQRNELEMETKSFKSQKENLLFFLWYVALHLIFGTLIGVRYDKCKYNINAGSLNWKREK